MSLAGRNRWCGSDSSHLDKIDPTTLNLCDASVLALAWPDAFSMAFTMRFFHGSVVGEQAVGTLVCLWPRSIRIDMTSDVWTGAPFTWDVAFTALDGGGWRVALDFGGTPAGGIELECNEMWMEVADETWWTTTRDRPPDVADSRC